MVTRTREINEHTCQHCGHVWLSKMDRPGICPKCKSYNWDKTPQFRRVIKEK